MWKTVESEAVEVEYAIAKVRSGREDNEEEKKSNWHNKYDNAQRARKRVIAPPIRTRVNKEKDTCKNFLLVCLTVVKLCRNSQLAIIKLFYT